MSGDDAAHPRERGSSEESRGAVLAALAANVSIAIAKAVAFAITGSVSMLAETFHSVADSGNQGLLLVGRWRGGQPADEDHPFGHGGERYFWGFVVAVLLFALGSLFALLEGEEKLRHPHDPGSPVAPLVVIGLAFVFEGLSLVKAVRTARREPGSRPWFRFIHRTKNAELPVVLLEDSGALVGLVFAAVGIVLADVTGNARFDALGSLAIGLLLGVIAITLAIEMKSLLVGESATPEAIDALSRALRSTPGVSELRSLQTLQLGPEELLVTAEIRLERTGSVDDAVGVVADATRRAREAAGGRSHVHVTPA
ncbi:MAG: cation diffusion facilitator family transporter [Acidimicrobiales bacterium]